MAVKSPWCERPSQAKHGVDILQDVEDKKLPPMDSEISKMFSGSTVFITGATGFLGKLLVEKLLRSCTMKKLYILIRPKKNEEPQRRIQDLFCGSLFDRTKKKNPNFTDQIAVVPGDISKLGLGMTEEDRKQIFAEVQFIFHCAATVNFGESLKSAVETNVRGTKEILGLAKGCERLKAMVHISTAYSNCPQETIEEKFYESPMPGSTLIDLAEYMDETLLEEISPKLLGKHPNSYTFSKNCAEDFVRNNSEGLPLVIVRPSIVTSTAREPIPGWIDNYNGPNAIIIGVGVGIMHTMHMDTSKVSDLVPGDMVVNACLAAAWKKAKELEELNEMSPTPDLCRHEENTPTSGSPPTIYNYVSRPQNPVTLGYFLNSVFKHGSRTPHSQAVYHVFCTITKSKLNFWLLSYLLHWLPAYIVDGIAVLIGRKPVLKKIYRKAQKLLTLTSYFRLNEWNFTNHNAQALFDELNATDKQMFNFDMSSLDWDHYFSEYVPGIRQYLLKDPLETVPRAVTRNFTFKIVHYCFLTVIGLLFITLSWKCLKLIE